MDLYSREQDTEGSWDLLARQCRQIQRLQVQGEAVSPNKVKYYCRRHLMGTSGFHTHVCKHTQHCLESKTLLVPCVQVKII